MTNPLITRLVVGEPKKLALGKPVGQNLGEPTGAALHWKAGNWVGARAPRLIWLSRLLARIQLQSIVVPTAAAKSGVERFQRLALVGAGVAVSVGGLGLGLAALRNQLEASGELPIAPAATVRIVQSAYVPPQQEAAPAPVEKQPFPIAKAQPDAVTPPLPFSPPLPEPAKPPAKVPAQEVTKPAVSSAQKPPEPAAKAQPPVPPKATPARQEPQTVPAVVLDEAAPRGSRAPAPAPTVPAQAAVPVNQSAPAVPPAPKPPIERGTGLIAITPDGKVAVFTNPKTKLPQQFKIGEQLPGGDTIRSIDAKEGKVVTSMKEYSLD
jgi:hypothetical protein